MRKQHTYGKRNDGTFLFPISFTGVRHDTISALFFDENDMEVSPDTWMKQTGSFIKKIEEELGDQRDGLIAITPTVDVTPTNELNYGLACEVHYDKAAVIQNMITEYIRSLSNAFVIEYPRSAS
jgi:hypothetical protein